MSEREEPGVWTLPGVRERFDHKYDVRSNGCWVWKVANSRKGYGFLQAGGRSWPAHRISFELAHERRISAGMVIMHTCDNPPCVNPDHLREGTAQDNYADMVSKGRQRGPKGEQHGSAKLVAGDVRAIREMYGHGTTQTHLAAMFGVTQSAISLITRDLTWRHLL